MLSLQCFVILFFISVFAIANNLTVTNVSIVNVSGGVAEIQFDIAWSNSWRYTETDSGRYITNHDAAWVFIKYRTGTEWKHAWLTAAGHTASAGAKIDVASNGGDTNIGAYVYRAKDGNGNMVCNNMRLRWDYTKNGLTKTNDVDVSVHAIEMVYIPQCSFYVGSGGAESYYFYKYPNITEPYYITNSDAINIGTVTGELYYSGNGDRTGPIPSTYPNGYKAFYCMKYEISQGQYADFLNFLPGGYDFEHYPDEYGNYRYTIHLTNSSYVADTPDRACNYLSWADVFAYCDWAGLRPMSELEFEKTCRGNLRPTPNEYAWGDTMIVSAQSFDGVDGSGTETVHEVTANCNYNRGVNGPIRVGIFAKTATIRHQAGAGFYGVMELSGNIEERIVGVGVSKGREYFGNPGDGNVSTIPVSWPSSSTGEGAGLKGGSWNDTNANIHKISDRTHAVQSYITRNQNRGGRGVRSVR